MTRFYIFYRDFSIPNNMIYATLCYWKYYHIYSLNIYFYDLFSSMGSIITHLISLLIVLVLMCEINAPASDTGTDITSLPVETKVMLTMHLLKYSKYNYFL